MLPALFVLALSLPLNAQDDLYYDPSTDTKTVTTYEEDNGEQNNVTRRYDEDDNYYDEDDYAYEYSSRIRRFHRPAQMIDYYDPFFVDLWYYDPFFLPGASIYTYGFNDYWTWRRWQRWQRWNAWNSWNTGWGYGWNNWSWSVNYGWGGWNAWNNPCVWNNYYYDPYWTWNGYNPYYGNVWVNNNYYYNNQGGYNNGGGGYVPQTYTGPRRHGTSVHNGYARLADGNKPDGRLVVGDKDVKVIDLRSAPRSSRVVTGDKTPTETPAARINEGSRRPAPATKDPVRTTDRARDVDRTRPETERPDRDVTPGRRPSTQPENNPRTEEPRPSRRPSPQPEPRQRTEEPRPSRSGGSENIRPSRPSSEDRPSRSGGGEIRPSRSNDSGGSKWNSGSSERSSSGSSGSSSGRSSSGSSSSSKSSSGGGRGRN